MGVALNGGVEAHGQRLDQRPLQGAHIVRQLEAQVRLVRHILLEYAVHRRGGKEHHIRAQVIFALPAEPAMAAGLARLQGHPVAHLQMRDLAAHLHHSAARLMAEHKGRLYHEVADGAGLIIVHVGAADAHILQLDQHLILPGSGNGALGKAHFADTFHDCHTHIAIHRMILRFLFFVGLVLSYQSGAVLSSRKREFGNFAKSQWVLVVQRLYRRWRQA